MPTTPQAQPPSARQAAPRLQTASPGMSATGEVVDDMKPLYHSGNSTRSAFRPEASQVGIQSGYAQTVVAGSGSGQADRMYYTPLPVPLTALTPFGSGAVTAGGAGVNHGWFQGVLIGHRRMRHPQAATLDETTLAAKEEWLRQKLVEFKGRLGELTGGSGLSINQHQRFARDITILNDYTAGTADVVHNATLGPAMLVCGKMQCERLEVEYANAVPTGESGTAATSMNGLSCAM